MKGQSFTVLMEKFADTNYSVIGAILNSLVLERTTTKGVALEKSVVKMLLSFTHSDQERKCLKYAIYKASGMSATAVRQRYGFEHMSAHAEEVEKAFLGIQQIRKAISDLASIEDTAMLLALGIQENNTDSLSSASEEEDSTQDCQPSGTEVLAKEIDDCVVDIKILLSECAFNWFEIMGICNRKICL